MPHYAPAYMLSRAVSISLIGCGGNGSQMLSGLAKLNHALRALGHPGLDVTVYDPDFVSEANMGRQLFSPADVGLNKAIVSVNRINAFYGLRWRATPHAFDPDCGRNDQIAIVCVDSAVARSQVSRTSQRNAPIYIMDLGNRAADGQVIFGEIPNDTNDASPTRTDHVSLRNPYDVLPELIDTTTPEDNTPSCGLAEALERQELFVNQAIVTPALSILWEFFRHGRLTWYGAFVNLRNGSMRAMRVQEAAQ